jgi:hypothetical protein
LRADGFQPFPYIGAVLATVLLATLGAFSTDARLLDAADLEAFAQVTPPPLIAPEPIAEPRDDGPLRTRLENLRAEPQPSLAGPIATLASGVGLVVTSVFFFYLSFVIAIPSLVAGAAQAAAPIVLLILGVVTVVPAVVLIIAGIKWLTTQLRLRREHSAQIRALENQLRGTPPAVTPGQPPPSVSAPQPALLLATF